MKLRTIIAIVLGFAVFVGLVAAAGLTGMYCDQDFSHGSTPLLCADTQAGFPAAGKVVVNVIEWLAVIGLPIVAGYLYARFGWPRKRGEISSAKAESV